MDRGAWKATVQGAAKSGTTERLNTHTHGKKTPGTIFTGFLISVLRKRVDEEADLTHIAVRKILICPLTQLFAQLVSCHLFVRVSQCRLCAGFWGVRLGALEVSVSQICPPTSCHLASVSTSGCQGVAQAALHVPGTHQHSKFLSQDGQMLSDTPVPAPSPHAHSGLSHRPAQSSLATV